MTNVSDVGFLLFILGWIISGVLHFGLINAYLNFSKNTPMLIFISLGGYCALVSAVWFLISETKPFKHGLKFNLK